MTEYVNVMGWIKTKKNSKTFVEGLVDLLYPKACPVCGEAAPVICGKSRGICPECEGAVSYIGDNYCMKCGKELLEDEQYCYDCKRLKHEFEQCAAVFVYSEAIKQSIYRYKYKGRREYAEWFAGQMYEKMASRIAVWEPELIVPIPLHKSKYKQRGYNQAWLLAAELGRLTGIPVDDGLLQRSRATEPMKALDGENRIKNLKNAFIISSNKVKYKKILLVDDIYTTGATMDACAKALRSKGVEQVYGLCLCIGRGI